MCLETHGHASLSLKGALRTSLPLKTRKSKANAKKRVPLLGRLFGRKKPKGFYFFFPFLAFAFFFAGILYFTSF